METFFLLYSISLILHIHWLILIEKLIFRGGGEVVIRRFASHLVSIKQGIFKLILTTYFHIYFFNLLLLAWRAIIRKKKSNF